MDIKREAEGLEALSFMEVCGTHTMSIFRNGIKALLPDNIRLLSGPGCPVCVTPNNYIDRAIALSRLEDVIITTFGDMIKVPGSSSSLAEEKARGRNIITVYSPTDALKLALDNPGRRVVFLGIGFETTVPVVAASIWDAKARDVSNFFVLVSHKLVNPAIRAILDAGELNLSGFLLPGHVSTIIGRQIYDYLADEYSIPAAIAGFEPVDILGAILSLVKQVNSGKASVENCYKRSVMEEGNKAAQKLMWEVYEVCDTEWRGIGMIPGSGLKVREGYRDYDALERIEVEVEKTKENPACICGEILRGVKTPLDCALFGGVCTPENPIGPCMVSSEGTCAAYYKYGG